MGHILLRWFLDRWLFHSNSLCLEILLFLSSSLADTGNCTDEAAHGEEDGEAGEGNVPPGATFSKAKVEERTFGLSC